MKDYLSPDYALQARKKSNPLNDCMARMYLIPLYFQSKVMINLQGF